MFVYGPYEKNNLKGTLVYFIEWVVIVFISTLVFHTVTDGVLSILSSAILGCLIALIYLFGKIVIKIIGEEKVVTPLVHRIIGIATIVCSVIVIPFAAGGLITAAADALMGSAPTSLYAIITGIITIIIVCACEVKGTQLMKLFSPLIGLIGGMAVAAIISVVGSAESNPEKILIDFSILDNLKSVASQQPSISGAFSNIRRMDVSMIIPCVAFIIVVICTIIELHNDEKLESGRRSTKKGMSMRAIIIVIIVALTLLAVSVRYVAAIISMVPTCVVSGLVIGISVFSIATAFRSISNKG